MIFKKVEQTRGTNILLMVLIIRVTDCDWNNRVTLLIEFLCLWDDMKFIYRKPSNGMNKNIRNSNELYHEVSIDRCDQQRLLCLLSSSTLKYTRRSRVILVVEQISFVRGWKHELFYVPNVDDKISSFHASLYLFSNYVTWSDTGWSRKDAKVYKFQRRI